MASTVYDTGMKNPVWLINRLRLMSFAEMVFRFKRSFLQKLEKRKVLSGWQPLPKTKITSNAVLFGTESNLLGDWSTSFKLDNSRLEKYLSGEIDFFGHDYFNIGQPVAWHTDPVTQTVSPLEFGKTLDYRDDSKVGNVKFIWELGRHQHLVPLAMAYAVTGDKKYRTAITEQIDGWINDNPYAMGIHWCSALELALRLISWSLVHSFIALRDGDEGLFAAMKNPDKFGLSVFQQAYFIRHYLSLYSSANNHLIGELTGLWTTCQVFDLGRQGDEWSDFALEELEKQADLQVYSDGVDKEQAAYYHLWVLEYFLFVWLTGNHINPSFSGILKNKIEAMSGFLRSIAPDNGQPPAIGDADDGFVARFEPEWPVMPYREILSVIDFIADEHASPATQKAFWYAAIIKNQPLSAPLENTWQRQYPQVYQQGGYAILGNQHCHLVFDGGSLGYLSIAAHGHADALSFCLAIEGDWWLVDPGTYAYHSDARWRNYFRGTGAHNTIKFSNADQSIIAGPFMWSRRANAKIEGIGVDDNRQFVRASHDGYRHIGASHQRCLRFDNDSNEITIEDNLSASNECNVEINFHFSPDVSLQYDESKQYWVAKHQKTSRELVFILDKVWTATSHRGEVDPIMGWYSPALEEKHASWVLHGEARIQGDIESMIRLIIR